MVLPDGATVQVRYLANSGPTWVNEHRASRIGGVVLYALVIFEAFVAVGVLVFPSDELGPICAALGKRYPHQDSQLLLTGLTGGRSGTRRTASERCACACGSHPFRDAAPSLPAVGVNSPHPGHREARTRPA